MSASNRRIKAHDTVHHLVSRVAHRVYFLMEDERNDFMEYVRRVSIFAGVQLIGWCIMANHFHLLVYLPISVELDEGEILRRFGVLKGRVRQDELAGKFARWRQEGESGEIPVQRELARLRRRMYNIGEYMRTLKQWFSEVYNSRNAHKGTLWESVYRDKVVPNEPENLREVLAYLHLNPVRAAVTTEFDDYAWSSLTAFRQGDLVAEKGMRFVYGNTLSNAEILAAHRQVMQEALETEKIRRAMEVARVRAAGYEMPPDPLTSEALVVQMTAHVAMVRKEIVALHEARNAAVNRTITRELVERQICELLAKEGALMSDEIIDRLAIPRRSAFRYLDGLQRRGVLKHESRRFPWQLAARSGQI